MATQCEIVAETAVSLQPALQELTRQAAQGEVVHNDDTSMRVLSLDRDADISPERTGVFTSGVVWIFQERRIALFFTGCKHAGENLAEVLKQRPTDLPPPIQMCDALSRNVPKSFATLLANCLTHGRRNFVEVTSSFPEECRFVLETLGEVYGYDDQARTQGLSPAMRLREGGHRQAHLVGVGRVLCSPVPGILTLCWRNSPFMARNFNELRAKMSPESRARSEAMTREMLANMPLDELRATRNLTQEHLASILHIKQASVSKMERRTDMYIGTLSKFIEAMGGQLEIRAIFPDGSVRITQFSRDQ